MIERGEERFLGLNAGERKGCVEDVRSHTGKEWWHLKEERRVCVALGKADMWEERKNGGKKGEYVKICGRKREYLREERGRCWEV